MKNAILLNVVSADSLCSFLIKESDHLYSQINKFTSCIDLVDGSVGIIGNEGSVVPADLLNDIEDLTYKICNEGDLEDISEDMKCLRELEVADDVDVKDFETLTLKFVIII